MPPGLPRFRCIIPARLAKLNSRFDLLPRLSLNLAIQFSKMPTALGDRLMVRRVALAHLIGVRIPVSQPYLFYSPLNKWIERLILSGNWNSVPAARLESSGLGMSRLPRPYSKYRVRARLAISRTLIHFSYGCCWPVRAGLCVQCYNVPARAVL